MLCSAEVHRPTWPVPPLQPLSVPPASLVSRKLVEGDDGTTYLVVGHPKLALFTKLV